MRLPDFVIIGAQKCGTTAAINALAQHPDVDKADSFKQRIRLRDRFLPKEIRPKQVINEPHFFTYRWGRGLDWYMGLFTSDAAVVGEKTPAILHHPAARRRMAEVVPDAKLIALLRHPVTRSYSQWNHYNSAGVRTQRWGWEAGQGFSDTMEADRNWIATRSMYATHVRAILELFSKEQLHVAIAERVKADPQAEYDRMFRFLGVEPHPVEELSRRSANIRSYEEPISAEDEARWNREFAGEIRDLRHLLDDPIPEWD